jgi:hypothetical protein
MRLQITWFEFSRLNYNGWGRIDKEQQDKYLTLMNGPGPQQWLELIVTKTYAST